MPPSPGDYRWPGNIRQLHNVIETAVLLEPSNQISLNELPEEIRKSANREGYFTVFLGSPFDEVERELIRRTIAFADGNNARASEILGVPSRTLRETRALRRSTQIQRPNQWERIPHAAQ